jgi:iron-sulfur cluster assembly 1
MSPTSKEKEKHKINRVLVMYRITKCIHISKMMLVQRLLFAALLCATSVSSFHVARPPQSRQLLFSSSSADTEAAPSASNEVPPIDYEIPEDVILTLKPSAMNRLRELRDKQPDKSLVLRMGVRSGGCSGMSYVMDFSTADAIQEDDEVDDYAQENIKCVVDSKSMLYLYGLELDYSDKLVGGGFRFYNRE